MDGEIDGWVGEWQREQTAVAVKSNPSGFNTARRLSRGKKHLGTDGSANLPGAASLHGTPPV